MRARRKWARLLAAGAGLALLAGCTARPQGGAAAASSFPAAGAPQSGPAAAAASSVGPGEQEAVAAELELEVGGRRFTAALQDNAAADALAALVRQQPLTLELRDYSGFEKVGPLGANLPAEDVRMTAEAGDIVLYGGSRIVLFYGSNTWSYTPLARVGDLDGWADALGGGDVRVTLSPGD